MTTGEYTQLRHCGHHACRSHAAKSSKIRCHTHTYTHGRLVPDEDDVLSRPETTLRVVASRARLLAVNVGAGRHGLQLDVSLFARLFPLLLRAERWRTEVADKARTSVLRPIAALQREVSVRHVLGRIRRKRLIPLDRRALLLHLHVAENGDQHHEHDEAHAAAHDQAKSSRQDARDAASIAHRAVAHY